MTSVIANQKVYSYDFILVAGAGNKSTDDLLAAGCVVNGSSQFLSIELITPNGNVGVPRVYYDPTPAAGDPAEVVVKSSDVADTSTYRVKWWNAYEPSPALTQGGVLAGAQFAP